MCLTEFAAIHHFFILIFQSLESQQYSADVNPLVPDDTSEVTHT